MVFSLKCGHMGDQRARDEVLRPPTSEASLPSSHGKPGPWLPALDASGLFCPMKSKLSWLFCISSSSFQVLGRGFSGERSWAPTLAASIQEGRSLASEASGWGQGLASHQDTQGQINQPSK